MGLRRFSSRFVISFLFFLALAEVPCLFSSNGVEQNKAGLQRFYVVGMRVSDASPFWFDYIFDVRPDGDDVLIRAIRIAPENEYCGGFVEVKALEKRLPGTSVGQVAGDIDLCSIQEDDADGAIGNAKPKKIATIFESEKFGIVAQCQRSERLFLLPYPETLDMPMLKRNAPRLAALYDLESRAYECAFGNKDVFYHITPAEDIELQRFGTSLVEELRAGKYDLGFGDENSRKLCRGASPCVLGLTRVLLEGYEAPGHKPHVPTVTLFEPERYHLAKYVAPDYPRLATMARIEGKVEVEISVDRASGTVTQVHAISGHPLLQKSAENAVKNWAFRGTDGLLTEPVSAVLNFSLGCADTPSQQLSP